MRKVNIMAGEVKEQAKKCDWKGCEKEHYDGVDSYEQKAKAELDRGKYVGEWFEPYNILLPAYVNHGIKEGKNEGLISGSYSNMKNSDKSHYSTQNHHVIPVDVLKKGNGFDKLRHNLELLGWNINNGLLNGICLPYFRQDYIWHNLQPHRGSHPKEYTTDVKNYLKDIQKACKKFCTNAEDELSDVDQETLLTEMNDSVTEIRNEILDWNIRIHLQTTLDKWKKLAESAASSSGQGGCYKKDAKSSRGPAPKLSKPSGREYFELI